MNNLLSRDKTRVFLLSAALIATVSALVLAWAILCSPREPSYQGKTLSAWIVPFCRQTPKGFDAPSGPAHFDELQPVRHAVTAIGTNGVPFLMRWVSQPETRLHRFLRQLLNKQPYQSFRLADPAVQRLRAIRALAVLGVSARAAVPSLVPTLSDPALATHSVYALSTMGPDGMRALVSNFTNTVATSRFQIAAALVSPKTIYRGENVPDTDTNQIPDDLLVEGLCRLIDNPSPLLIAFRMQAIMRLSTAGPAASNAVPVLIGVLNERNPALRHFVIRTLGNINAPEVIPALTNLLSDPDPGTRMAAVSALRGLGYDAQFQPMLPATYTVRPSAPYATPARPPFISPLAPLPFTNSPSRSFP